MLPEEKERSSPSPRRQDLGGQATGRREIADRPHSPRTMLQFYPWCKPKFRQTVSMWIDRFLPKCYCMMLMYLFCFEGLSNN
jgi:hypothetical protein